MCVGRGRGGVGHNRELCASSSEPADAVLDSQGSVKEPYTTLGFRSPREGNLRGMTSGPYRTLPNSVPTGRTLTSRVSKLHVAADEAADLFCFGSVWLADFHVCC